MPFSLVPAATGRPGQYVIITDGKDISLQVPADVGRIWAAAPDLLETAKAALHYGSGYGHCPECGAETGSGLDTAEKWRKAEESHDQDCTMERLRLATAKADGRGA